MEPVQGQSAPAAGENQTIFQSNLPLAEKLERARVELLDLSARNRLLNMPRGARSGRSIEIIDEKIGEIFRLLVREGKTFTFVAGRAAETKDPASEGTDGVPADASTDKRQAEPDEIEELAQPDDESRDERGVLRRHADTRLQTRLTSKGLQSRLLELYLDARTLEEEQGVNVLYLAMGALKWIDPNNAENIRYLAKLFMRALMIAYESHERKIKRSLLTQAFIEAVWSDGVGERNPFSTNFHGRQLIERGEPFYEDVIIKPAVRWQSRNSGGTSANKVPT